MLLRRDFLALGCGAVCGLATAADRPRIGFGFSLYGMKSLPLEEAITACAKIGYDCVELPVMADWPGDSGRLTKDDRRRIRDRLRSENVRLTALMENLNLLVDADGQRRNLDRLKAAGELAHDLDPDHPPLIETILGGKPAEWLDVRERMAERLADWAKVAAETQSRLAIKAHVAGAAHLPEHPVWLAKRVDSRWVRCVFDQSHFELRGIPLADSLRELLPHSIFIHIKDSQGDASRFQFLLPGDGRTNYAEYVKQVRTSDYRGDIVIEVSGQIHGRPGYQPLDAARRCYAKLAAAFRQ